VIGEKVAHYSSNYKGAEAFNELLQMEDNQSRFFSTLAYDELREGQKRIENKEAQDYELVRSRQRRYYHLQSRRKP
jgi:hypothetical protein